MDFVWFYAEKFSAWHFTRQFYELDYSIRSVRKNYRGDVRCFVIGDDPKLDVIHLKAPPTVADDQSLQQPRHMDNMLKCKVLLESEINEEFVLMYDDIYLLKPTTREEIMTTYGLSEVGDPNGYIKIRGGGTPYKKLWVSTYDYIKTYRDIKGLKTYDWETHLPRFQEKTKLKWIIETLNLMNIPRIFTSLYSAYPREPWKENSPFMETTIMPEGFQSDMFTHTPGMDFDKEFACHYMNIGDGIIIPEFMDRMKALFGE